MAYGLYMSAAVVGLVASPHCMTMCGAICEKSASTCETDRESIARRFLSYLPVLLGRLFSYATAGALIGLFTSASITYFMGTSWLRPIWVLFQFFIFITGVWMLIVGRLPDRVIFFVGATKNMTFFKINSKPDENHDKPRYYYLARSFGLGSLWSLLPCGVLHSAFLIASLVNSPLEGALVMLSFGVASSVALLSGGWLWGYLMKTLPSHDTLGGAPQGSVVVMPSARPEVAAAAAASSSAWSRGTFSYRLAGLAVTVAGAWSMYRLLFSMANSGVQCG